MTYNDITEYFRSSVEELKKVAWPSRELTLNASAQVMIMSVAVALFLAGVDYLLSYLLQFVLNR